MVMVCLIPNTRQNWRKESSHFLFTFARFNEISEPFFSIVIVDLICLILILIHFISFILSLSLRFSFYSLAYIINGKSRSFSFFLSFFRYNVSRTIKTRKNHSSLHKKSIQLPCESAFFEIASRTSELRVTCRGEIIPNVNG